MRQKAYNIILLSVCPCVLPEHLKVEIVESEDMAFARQWLSKNSSVTMNISNKSYWMRCFVCGLCLKFSSPVFRSENPGKAAQWLARSIRES
jgi:hypothetical protein